MYVVAKVPCCVGRHTSMGARQDAAGQSCHHHHRDQRAATSSRTLGARPSSTFPLPTHLLFIAVNKPSVFALTFSRLRAPLQTACFMFYNERICLCSKIGADHENVCIWVAFSYQYVSIQDVCGHVLDRLSGKGLNCVRSAGKHILC